MALESCGMHSGFFGYGWLIQLLIFIGFFFIVWWLIKDKRIPSEGAGPREKPIEILKRRFASGELTKKEFDRLKKEIE